MFRNYFKTGIRNLLRHKTLSAINIIGLATGIACCTLIALYVYNEISYDRFQKKADRIARVTMEYASDGVALKLAVTGNKVFPAFKRDFPEVENGVRTWPTTGIVKYGDKLFDEKNFLYADSTFFDIFSFPLLEGDRKNVLNRPNQVVLTVSSSKKYFGNENPVGKILRINNEKDYQVTGLVGDCPANSQIKFDFLASFYSLEDYVYKEETWWNASYYTYLLLKEPGDIKNLDAKIPAYMQSLDKDNIIHGKSYLTFHLEALKDVHLYSQVEGGIEPGGDYHYIYIFSIIALLILAIASANYINLTTARAVERAKEVGIRKVAGAIRKQLFSQFIGESLLIIIMALLAGLLLVKLLLPTFNLVAARQFSFGAVFSTGILLTLSGILLVVALAGGSYPALVLSGFNPIRVLKGNFKTGAKGIWLRKGLIIVQFVISVVLIISTIVIHGQLSFIQNKKLGYDREHVLVLPLDKFVQGKLNTLRTELSGSSNILGMTTCNQTPVFIPGKYGLSLNSRAMNVTAVRTDKNFIKTLGLTLISGSDFTDAEQKLIDSENIQRPLILNEAAVKNLGWTPDNAIGQSLNFQGRKSIVRGVVNDFHFSSLHDPVTPFVIFLSSNVHHILVKLSGHELPQTIQFMKEKWSELAPHRPFEYEFLDDQFNKLYSTETSTGRLFYVFAMLAVMLASLGLFGLIMFTAQQRAKEIGIRKILGASVINIAGLLSKDFLKLVIVASVVAFPLAWWAMNKWLENFAYRIHINGWVFALAGAAAIAIALITVSFQAIKAAIANPVRSLRTE